MIYNFRFDRDRREIIFDRLQSRGELCQGWGGGLDSNHDLRGEQFEKQTVETYDMSNTNVATNLTTIRDFEDGDWLVTAHLPENGTVSIHEVKDDFPDCYEYVNSDDTHLNHRIRIRQSWGLDGNISVDHWRLSPWKAKLRWFRLPVISISGVAGGFREIVSALQENPGQTFEESDRDEYLGELKSHLVSETRSQLERIAPSESGISFEEVALFLLESAGYNKKRGNYYDGEGGDVDVVLNRADVTPFENDETRLFVQIKKHTGQTGKQAVEQVLQMMNQEPDAGGCVITLADGFTTEARELAERNGIVLIDGPTTCRLLMQEITNSAEIS